jgi:hypothetical protein
MRPCLSLERCPVSITFQSVTDIRALSNGLDVEVYELFRHDHSPVAQRTLFERFKKDITKNIIDTLISVYKAYE